MFDKVLVPTDGTELSDKAVDQAIEYCRRTGAAMTALYVRPHTPIANPVAFGDYGEASAEVFTPQNVRERYEAFGRGILQRVADRARARGVDCASVLAVNDHPYRAIIETAGEQGCSLIFMASHGRSGLEAILLGSETQKVLTHSKIPVLVFR